MYRRGMTFWGFLLILAMAAPALGAQSPRVVSDPYEIPSGVATTTPVQRGGWMLPIVDTQAEFVTGAGERFVTIAIKDDLGGAVAAYIAIDRNDNDRVEAAEEGQFCQETEKPLLVKPGQSIWVWPVLGTCEDGTPAIVSRGEITATFSR